MPDSLTTPGPSAMAGLHQGSALDVELRVTVFGSHAATEKIENTITLRDLVPHLLTTERPSKTDLPWLKLASFGDTRTDRGSLRHDANMTAIHGVEADYDGGQITLDRARQILRNAGLAAVVYTSPSHTAQTPRWRILCPASRALPPDAREGLLARLNGLFVGALAPESFSRSQSYYFGHIPGAADHAAFTVEGRAIDTAHDLDHDAIGRPKPTKAPSAPVSTTYQPSNTEGLPWAKAALERECNAIRYASEGEKHRALNRAAYSIGGLVAGGALPEGEAFADLAAALNSIKDRCADFRHAEKTLRSSFEDGKAKPRSVPEPTAMQEQRVPFGIGDSSGPLDYDPETGIPVTEQNQQDSNRLESQPIKSPLWIDAAAWDAAAIPKRPWAVPSYLMRGSVSVLTGQGAGGKSSLVVAWTIACATGEAIGNFAPRAPMACVNYNVEDDREEQQRRYSAALAARELNGAEVMPRIVRCGPHDVGTLFERDPSTGRITETTAMLALERICMETEAELLVCDPLAELHNAEENDNTAMRSVVAAFRSLARRLDISVLLLHHNRKGGSTPGDMDQMRGASAISGAVRVVLTLAPMTEEEADKLGVNPDERRRHFRIDGAKSNYAIAGEAEWWKLAGYEIGNGETVAACLPWEPPSAFGDLSMSACVSILTAINAGRDGIAFAAKRQSGEDWAGKLLTVAPHGKTEGQASTILNAWAKAGMIIEQECPSPRRGHTRRGYVVNTDALQEMRRQVREGVSA